MTEAMPYLTGERVGRIAVITLDDGCLDNFLYAAPILKKHGCTATCYAVSQHMGSFNQWDAARLNVKKPLMSRDQLREWASMGLEVGAHTQTHARLTQTGDYRLNEEIDGCKSDLEAVLGTPVTQFSYPHGNWDSRAAHAVRSAGFRAAVTTRRGRSRPGDELFCLPRVKVRGCDFPLLFALKILTRYEDRHQESALKRRAPGRNHGQEMRSVHHGQGSRRQLQRI